MITGPLFKWFGSKWLSAKTLPPPQCGHIVEPFAGGAGYALRYADLWVTICDSDPHLRVLWPWLISEATEGSIREIPLNVPEGVDIRTLGLSLGQATLLKTWQRTNNVGDCWTISPWGNKPGQWTANTRARVAEESQTVKHWRFEQGGAFELMSSREACTWFVDPPYQYNYMYRKAPIDYAALSRFALSLRGQVIVCEAVCPKTGAVPQWLPFVPFSERVTSRRKAHQSHHSKELIYVH